MVVGVGADIGGTDVLPAPPTPTDLETLPPEPMQVKVNLTFWSLGTLTFSKPVKGTLAFFQSALHESAPTLPQLKV